MILSFFTNVIFFCFVISLRAEWAFWFQFYHHRSRGSGIRSYATDRHTDSLSQSHIGVKFEGAQRCLLPWFETFISTVNDKIEKNCNIYLLGSVAGPVIQATGRLEFEDALWLSGPLYGPWAPLGCPHQLPLQLPKNLCADQILLWYFSSRSVYVFHFRYQRFHKMSEQLVEKLQNLSWILDGFSGPL